MVARPPNVAVLDSLRIAVSSSPASGQMLSVFEKNRNWADRDRAPQSQALALSASRRK
jgi:hypothetical protein